MTDALGWDRDHLWRYRAKWLPDGYADGDTFTVLVDSGHWGRREVRIRLLNYSMPELNEEGGVDAMVRLMNTLRQGVGLWPLRVVTHQKETVVAETTSFERYVATVYIVDINRTMRDVVSLLSAS